MKQELINRLNRAGLQVKILTPQQENKLKALYIQDRKKFLQTSICQYFQDCVNSKEVASSMKIADLNSCTGREYLQLLTGEEMPSSLELRLNADDMRIVYERYTKKIKCEDAMKNLLLAEEDMTGLLDTVLHPHVIDSFLEPDGSRTYRLTRGQGAAPATVADLKMDEQGFLSVKAYYRTSERLQQAQKMHIPELFQPVKVECRYLSAPHMFYSNAENAVNNIRQEKATPAQWLAMIQKNGGIKAGEERWLGLAEWLRKQEAKSLTKQEVLLFIDSNRIELHEEDFEELAQAEEWKELNREYRNNIDEVYENYREADIELDEFYNEMRAKYQEEDEWDDDYLNRLDDEESEREQELLDKKDKYDTNCYAAEEIAFNMMVDKYGEAFDQAFAYDGDCLQVASESQAAKFISVNEINGTRRECVTEGLDKYRELALWSTNAEQWEEKDNVHFGQVGQGRCIGWIRFGEITIKENVSSEELNRRIADMPGPDKWKFYDGKQFVAGFDLYYPPNTNYMDKTAYISKSKDDLCYTYHPLKGPGIICTSLKEAVNLYNSIHIKRTEEKKILVIDEIQSNRHQEGRKKGYQMTKDEEQKFVAEYNEVIEAKKQFLQSMREKYDTDMFALYMSDEEVKQSVVHEDKVRQIGKRMMEEGQKIPGAPFEKNWHELCMKRMLQYAAEQGFDRVAWTKGQQQVKRYNLARVVQEIGRGNDWGEDKYVTITYNHSDQTGFYVKPDGHIYDSTLGWDGKHVDELFGKELAEKVLQMHTGNSMDVKNLTIGKDGMMKFYDTILPTFMNNYGRKWGIQVGEQSFADLSKANDYITEPLTMHAIEVTPEMKQSVMQGQPMFRIDKKGMLFGFTMDDTIYLTQKGFDKETLIHEYTHIWARAMMNGNPQAWESVKDLLRDTPVWEEVCKDPYYRDIRTDKDCIASEVLARISGRQNAYRLTSLGKEAPEGVLDKIKSALETFWSWVGKHIFDIDRFRSTDEVVDRVLYDLLSGKPLDEGQSLHSAPPLDTGRISHVITFKGLNDQTYIRCRIDGQQQMAQPVKSEDIPETSDTEKLMPLAARYFSKELEEQSRNTSMKR